MIRLTLSSSFLLLIDLSFGFVTGGRRLFAYNGKLKAASGTFDVVALEGDEASISEASDFMMDAFWLSTPLLVQGDGDLSAAGRSGLVEEQAFDFTSKYGERLGQRQLKSSIVAAKELDSATIVGVIGAEVTLYDGLDIMPAEKAEDKLKNVVASLGPKQRREYKNSSVQRIADELLPSELSVVCCLSNLAVAQSSRGQGVGVALCKYVEALAAEWQFDRLYLKVEEENEAARSLYETKLGYEQESKIENSTVLRLDLASESFVESASNSLVLSKSI